MTTLFASNGADVGRTNNFVERLSKLSKESINIAMSAESTTSVGFKIDLTDLTSGGTIAVSGNALVLKTKASGGAYASWKSKETYTAAKRPEHMQVIALATTDNIEFRAGLYKDSYEYCEFYYNSSSGATIKAVIHNATGSEVSVDTGITAGTTQICPEVILSATGVPRMAINGTEVTLGSTFQAKLLTGACYQRCYVKALAAGAEIARVYNIAMNKRYLVTFPNQN